MKLHRALLLSGAFVGMTVMAPAAAILAVAEGVDDTNYGTSGPGAAGDDTFNSDLEIIPPPSDSDLINGLTATQVGGPWNNHDNSGVLDFAAFVNGNGDTAYPGQLPADQGEGNYDPVADFFFDLGGATDIGAVIFYGYNYNNDAEGDIRAVIIANVYTTTDATPTAGGNWDVLYEYGPPTAPPLELDWTETSVYRGVALAIVDDEDEILAADITGIRFEIFASGFGNQLRDPATVGSGVEAVTSPFIAEIDVLAPGEFEFNPNTVGDWTLY